MIPARGKLFVKLIETGETLPGGKILLTDRIRADLTASQMEVMSVGYPAQCPLFPDCERPHLAALSAPVGAFPDEPHFHPCAVKPGDWVLLAPRGLTETDDPTLFVCSQDAVLAILQA